MMMLEEERKRQAVEKREMSRKTEESSHIEELRRQEELKRLERQRLEQMIIQESKVSSGHVSKRIDDVHGLGWGNVKTGFVSKKKLGFLQREMSVDRDSNSSSPVGNGKGRGLRVTFADSPTGSRPASNLGWSDVRAQTPPLAGEWSATASTSTSTSASSTQQVATATNGSFLAQKSATASVQAKSFMSQQQQQQQSSSSSFQSSQSSTFSSSVQKSSFSSSHSSSIQASKAFEAFPGLGVIEN